MLERLEQQEQKKKYTLPDRNIIALGGEKGIKERMKPFLAGLKKEGIELPAELQGGGNDLIDRREFTIAYPLGDVFLSYVVTFHELGHLRQFEANPEIEFEDREVDSRDLQFRAVFRDAKHRQDKKALEINATKRGWQRVQEYAPEILEILEARFREYKEQGKLEKFKTFKELFDHIFKSLGIMEDFFFEQPKERAMDEQYGQEMAQRIKENPAAYEFFSNQGMCRVGEQVEQKEIENVIKKVAAGIAEEKYETS